MMKRFLFAAVLTLCTIATVASQQTDHSGSFAKATFTHTSHDFGSIREDGGLVSHTFEFTNTGTLPLLIIESVASCGCTKPEYPDKPIKPGKKGKIKVTYSPLGRPGSFHKTVKVVTNGTGQDKRITLVITGTVIPKKQ